MGAKVGKLAKVQYNGANVLGMGKWSMSGFTREMLEDTEFGDDIKTFLSGAGDAGTLSIAGFYDPSDTTGQTALNALVAAGTVIPYSTSTGLKLFIDGTSYWAVGSGGQVLVTKGIAIDMDKNGLGQAAFEFKVSGAAMTLT
jgi:hypothetical protein